MKLFTVARKEWVDGFRDRRALYTLAFGSLFGPLMIGFMFNQIARQQKAAQEIEIPVAGREHAPILVDWLRQQAGVTLTAAPADPESAVRNRKTPFVLVIEKDFAAKFRESRPAPVQVVSDSTSQSTRAKVLRLNTLLRAFSAETGGMRLIARGVSPGIVSALKIDQVEVATAQQRAAMIFNFIPMFLVIALFTAGMPIASDSTAGERERGSLEPLLLNPLPRWQLVAGKFLAASGAALLGMLLTLAVMLAVLSRLAFEDLGVRNDIGAAHVMLIIAAVAPMAVVSASLQMFVSCFAKSFKEAQSYLGLLMLAPTIPGITAMFYPMTNQPWLHPLPVLGQYAMVADILGGKSPSALSLAAAAAAAVAVTAGLLTLASRLFASEKIIFGR